MGSSPNELGLDGGKTRVETEDDVLHVRSLPTFENGGPLDPSNQSQPAIELESCVHAA
jgi:hypothetical protein